MPGSERRRSVRYRVKRCTAWFRRRRLLLFFEGSPHKGPIVDISSHGLAFITRRTVRPGDVLVISLDIPFEVYAVPLGFKLKAKVRWVAAHGEQGLKRVGCEFHKLHPDELELITRIIRYGILRER